MTDNEFDDLFKKQFQQHESDVPADMWQRISGDKKRRRIGYIQLIYILALILISSIAGMYIFYFANNKTYTPASIAEHTKNGTEGKGVKGKNESIRLISKDEFANSKNKPANRILQARLSAQQVRLKKIINLNAGNNNNQPYTLNNNTALVQQQNLNDAGNNLSETDSANKILNAGQPRQTSDNNAEADSLEKNNDYDKISVQIFASPDLPFSTIHSDDTQYEQLLKNSVHTRLSYTIGAGINIAINKKISLSTGIRFSKINEVINFKDSAQGGNENLHNHFTFINVPFTLNYTTAWSTYFQTSIKAGILFNISSKYKGTMPNTFGELINLNQNVYKGNTGVSLYTAINFSKIITGRFDVFTEPYFCYQTKNITDNLPPFTRKIHTAGLALGVQYRLFKNKK